jgi:hypothetical protein
MVSKKVISIAQTDTTFNFFEALSRIRGIFIPIGIFLHQICGFKL